jgi:16S rRNA (uracil1498-N3)-methyltransferase
VEGFYTLNIRLIVSNFSFIDSRNIKDSSFILDEKESHHIISVLRLREGSNITLTDGRGNIYYGLIEIVGKKSVKGKILSIEKFSKNKHYHVHLGLPLIKNNKLKIAIEKSVELGVDEITPIKFDRSVKASINTKKIEYLIQTSCKQSMRPIFPKLNNIKDLYQWYDDSAINIACIIDAKKTLTEQRNSIFRLNNNSTKINLIIGPEGDFTDIEKIFLNEKNFIQVNLGRTILRTETAIVSLIAIVNELIANNE